MSAQRRPVSASRSVAPFGRITNGLKRAGRRRRRRDIQVTYIDDWVFAVSATGRWHSRRVSGWIFCVGIKLHNDKSFNYASFRHNVRRR